MPGPLADVRVLDLAGEAGLFAGRMLAEMGADVARVEPPGGDAARGRPPFLQEVPPGVPGPVSLYHLHFNAGKRGVTLDRVTPRGAALLQRLASVADIVLLTEPPSALRAQGLGYEDLAALNRSLIWVSITPFGPDGPMSGWRADDLVGVAMGGLMYLNGMPEDPPLAPGAEQAYHMASLAAVSGALLGLAGRERDSERTGRRVDVSMQEAVSMSTLQTANANIYAWHGRVPVRTGLGGSGIRNLFPCSDGKWVSFTIPVGPGPFWGHFVQWLDDLGIPHGFQDEEWADPAFRLPHHAQIASAIEALVSRLPRDVVFHEGQRRRMLVMPVNDVSDLLHDEQLRARGFFRPLEHPALGRSFEVPGPSYQFSATPAGLPRCAPGVGEHNAEVYREWLGLEDAEVRALAEAGVL